MELKTEEKIDLILQIVTKLQSEVIQIKQKISEVEVRLISLEKGESIMSVEISKIWSVTNSMNKKLDFLFNREQDTREKLEIHQTYLDNHDKRILRLEVRDQNLED